MKAFITGITGFAGSWLAEHLLACGDVVRGCSRSGRWQDDAPELLRQQVRVVGWDAECRSDIADQSLYDQLREFSPEVIYHLAALSIPDECGKAEPTERALRINRKATAWLAPIAASLSSQPRFLFVSSSHVYAPATADQSVFDETAPTDPRGGYGITKLAAERALLNLAGQRSLKVVIARAFQHTGPRQQPPLMLPAWASQFAAGTDPVQVHNLDTWLDLSDVRDVVRAYRLLAIHGDAGAVYNVGSGCSVCTGDLFARLRRLAAPSRQVIERSPGKKLNWIADITRLREATGWQPQISIDQTVADTWAYWRDKKC